MMMICPPQIQLSDAELQHSCTQMSLSESASVLFCTWTVQAHNVLFPKQCYHCFVLKAFLCTRSGSFLGPQGLRKDLKWRILFIYLFFYWTYSL